LAGPGRKIRQGDTLTKTGAGVGVALNCCARAHALALLAIPDLVA
jgi:hypothetical protein